MQLSQIKAEVATYIALKQMPRGRTTGPNSIPIKIFCIFHELVIHLLTNIFNLACQEGILPENFLLRDIMLLSKEGDQMLLDHKLPITLLNTIYKVFAKMW